MREKPLMPWSYEIDPARRLIRTTLAGTFSAAEADALYLALRNDPAFDPTFSELMDATQADGSGISTGKVRQSANRNLFTGASRRAILVSNDLSFGLARLYSTHVDINGGPLVNVFRKREEALRWLGLTSEPSASTSR